MASALKTTPGAASCVSACSSWSRVCPSGWFWQVVPRRFHMNGTASMRKTSTPRLASQVISPSIASVTAGLV